MIEAGLQPLPGYRLTRRLGAGAFSVVWEACHSDGSVVALKFLNRRSPHVEQFQEEARILKTLTTYRHPGIIHFFGLSIYAHYLVLRLERADGNLAELQDTYQKEFGIPVPRDHALDLLENVATTLDFLASMRLPGFVSVSGGLQHCDVKPANLLLVGDRLKVADFGLAAATSARAARALGWRGSPPYAAPELHRGQPSATSDQYGLAVTWCEVSVGPKALTKPAQIDSSPGMLPVDLMQLPESEVPVVSRALHPDPTRRWPSCQTFLAGLRAAQSELIAR
jgi:eukaryotic-like serine/threonine-protein kinase